MKRVLWLAAAVSLAMPAAAASAGRPPIVGVAKFSIKTDDLAAERAFFGGVLGFAETLVSGTPEQPRLVSFQVNHHQFIEVSPDLRSDAQDRLAFIAYETKDVRALREYLVSRGLEVAAVHTGADGNPGIRVQDPDGHAVEFVQFAQGAAKGQHSSDRQVSKQIAHVGVSVRDRAAADRFYRDILGFRLMWLGGPTDDRIVYVCMRVPDGADWIEYMLGDQPRTPKNLAAANHLSLEVPGVAAGAQTVGERGYHPPKPPGIGRNGRWQVNLFDHNLTRVELMEPKQARPPCCSPMIDP